MDFFAFLRSAEFLLADGVQYDPSRHLSLGDITFNNPFKPSQIAIKIKASKTDQERQGTTVYLNSTGCDLCPVAAVLDYLKIRGPRPGILFIHKNGGALTRSQLVKGIRKMLEAYSDINPRNYNSHSLRIGAATIAASTGVPETDIKRLGRWKSTAYQLYIRPPQSELTNISNQLLERTI